MKCFLHCEKMQTRLNEKCLWKASDFPSIETFFMEKLQKSTCFSVNSKTGFAFSMVVFQKRMRRAEAKM